MKLTINGDPQEIHATTLAEALAALELSEARVATALNGIFVPADARAARVQPLANLRQRRRRLLDDG